MNRKKENREKDEENFAKYNIAFLDRSNVDFSSKRRFADRIEIWNVS